MSKYDPLSARLGGQAGPEWRASFAEIEAVLGFPLPKAARAGRAWWKADAGAHARAWSDAGWDADAVDTAAGRVTFKRTGQSPLVAPAVAESPQPAAPSDETPAILQRLEATPKWGLALIAGGLAVVAGLGALAVRGFMRRRD